MNDYARRGRLYLRRAVTLRAEGVIDIFGVKPFKFYLEAVGLVLRVVHHVEVRERAKDLRALRIGVRCEGEKREEQQREAELCVLERAQAHVCRAEGKGREHKFSPDLKGRALTWCS